jgi:hypothetical protein
MRFHDYYLTGYAVAEGGKRIKLHLELEDDLSDIEFSGVAVYHFIHTGGTVITHIYETPLRALITRKKEMLKEWWHQNGGLQDWNDDASAYASRLEETGHRAWLIDSAIGFDGFVIGKELRQLPAGS